MSVTLDVPVAIAPASPEPYRVMFASGWAPAVAPKRIPFEDFEGLGGFAGWDLFVHHIDGGVRVSERLTGLAVVTGDSGVAATFTTEARAVAAALATLRHWGPGEFAKTVVRVLVARGEAR